jgi:hypothetical protein
MATNDLGQVIVPCRECRCPGAPDHLTDEVYLLPEPTLRMGISAQFAVAAAAKPTGFDDEDATQRFMEIFIRNGVAGWNLQLEDGSPKPLDKDEVLNDFSLGMPTADAASELYMVKVTAPLVRKLSTTSPTGQTGNSSSAANGRTPKRRGSSSRAGSVASEPLTQ